MTSNENVRICPTCGEINNVDAVACFNCGYIDMANVPITSLYDEEEETAAEVPAPETVSPPVIRNETKKPIVFEPQIPSSEAERIAPAIKAKKTAVEQRASLTFICLENKRPFQVTSGCILGREGIGRDEVFSDDIGTVSRRHARIVHNGVNWEIEDLESTNGTFINGERIRQGKRYPIKNGDILNFSMSCSLKVAES
jgi:hypothetical protein